MPIQADVCVLGGGPGGYVAALRTAALGAKVALVESDDVGGVCLNRGCIPSKTLLRSAEVYQLALHSSSYGVDATGVSADYAAMTKRADGVVRQLRKGVESLLDAAGVTVLKGRGRVAGAGAVEAKLEDRNELIVAPQIFLATGSSAAMPPIPGVDLPGVIDSDGAFRLTDLPAHILIAGAGAVGVEWATLFALLGSEVTLVEMLSAVVPVEDADVSETMRRILLTQGVQVHTDTRITAIAKGRGGLRIELESGDDTTSITATHALMATGRRPNIEDLGLQSAGVRHGPQGIEVDAHMQTSASGIYAVGDVTGQKLLAHVASHQGIVAAEHARGHDAEYDPRAVPACTFTHPEIASVGLTEAEARAQVGDVLIGRFPFQALGRARAYGETDGFVKLVAGATYGEILGMHVIGPTASDIISEGVLAIRLEATLDDLRETIHAHPTFPEATAEAAWQAIGQPVHLPARRARA